MCECVCEREGIILINVALVDKIKITPSLHLGGIVLICCMSPDCTHANNGGILLSKSFASN